MASLPTMKNIPNVENAFKASKKHKNKKRKKDKGKKHVPDFLLHDGCHEAVFTQMQETKKRKKAKKKIKPKEDFQQPTLNKQFKQPEDTHQTQPIICISPDQKTPYSPVKECNRSVKRKKRVVFNLPPEQSQAPKTNDEEYGKKQLVSESSLESNTAEEMTSQDLFITQKSFLDPYVEISSSSSSSTNGKVPENLSCSLTAEATTQTENFFTFPALSTSLKFQKQQQNTSKSLEEPVDLSLPNRTRQMHGPKQPTVDWEKPPMLKISGTSSEDGDTVPKAKGDLLQLKVIQTRLNESFFFKVKGEDSPKPMCPLMKLTERVEKRTKK
ncbi:uncharacterized protein LOC113043205 [Carassius auratus]|uniref:Uncharacterized protein LOC113043205 n=1 Tax=Carassius auratus TaxID=7957 RepID=A0A6P6JFQ0_CARAU|nr:uncharacterized protein LOC113043205 [Carassius auratus]XP_026058217.1 uncharacterized protein LOC113043205 [Carassius auratus]XP_052452949.1 uncharacterized protein LOC128013816 [Carassius gibelio]